MTPKRIVLRKCNGCQEMKSKKELIRVVHNDEGEIFIDKTGKKNGRGAYICPDTSCLEKAVKTRGLERSFKRQIPREIYEQLKTELEDCERLDG